MVQLLILYYLSLKSTHGYEIQKFIQTNQMEEWNSIQSGSIYYALSKLEKQGFIELVEKVGNREKSKRVYSITEIGLNHLKKMAINELCKPLASISSEKFLVYPIIANLTKEEMIPKINEHIASLENKISIIDKWLIDKQYIPTQVEQATFKIMKETVLNQIEWHKTLLNNLDEAVAAVAEISKLIKRIDFSDPKSICCLQSST